jgi:cell wall-active antibiotic response 4TMS protein YvqF
MRQRVPLVALLLIGLGVWFLLRNFALVPRLPADVASWWPVLLLAIGVHLLRRSVGGAGGRADALLPGMVLTIYGAFFLLVPLGLLRAGDLGRYWGVFPAAIGAGLLVQSLTRPAQGRRALVPAMVLLGVGTLGIADAVVHGIWRFWPVLLIAGGIALILRRRG